MLGIADEAMSRLTNREAFRAMTLFLTEDYERAGDDLVTLPADITHRIRRRHARPGRLGRLGPVLSARSRPGRATSRSSLFRSGGSSVA
jgi:hypothetical protein